MPLYPIPQGSYVFPFAVVEYNPLTGQYGFADYGVWTLTVNNKPPEVVFPPSEVKVNPGETVAADVQVTDLDNDQITLTQTSGPARSPGWTAWAQ